MGSRRASEKVLRRYVLQKLIIMMWQASAALPMPEGVKLIDDGVQNLDT